MRTYEIAVRGRTVGLNNSTSTLVRTSIGVDRIHVLFDNAEWLDFPVSCTFVNGETAITQPLTLAAVDSAGWSAEATCAVPWEVIEDLGAIALAFFGTDANSNHVITAESGSAVLNVEQEGEVGDGTVPSPAPSIDQWNQAYAAAMAAANDAESAAEQVSDILHSTDAQTLQELIDALGSCLRYKGSVATYADLPDPEEDTVDAGDTYNVQAAYGDYPAGTNWAWTGTAWDALGGETDLSVLAPKASPALTGTPTAPTASTGTNTTQIATTAFVQQEIGAQDAATTSTAGLMSATDKSKLDGIESNANAYELPTMSASTKGGAKLGPGLRVDDDALSLGPLVQSGSGDSVETDGCALFAVSGEGWSEQDSTVGKNLIWTTNITSYTENGLTFTRRQSDGAIVVSGTATAETTTYPCGTGGAVSLEAGTYTLSGCPSGGGASTYEMNIGGGTPDYGDGNTFTISNDVTTQIRIRIRNGVDLTNPIVFYPQLELGSTASSYEPYTGGAPSPSPDYPQEIRVCRGRNLASMEYGTQVPSIVNGEMVSGSGWSSGFIEIDPSNEYYFKSNGSTSTAYVVFYDSSKAFLSAKSGAQSGFLLSTQSGYSGAKYVKLRSDTVSGTDPQCQLELGSTPTPYVPYGHVGLEVHDGDTDALISCTPIPLPLRSDGERWAAGLPDGTADSLALDSAGHVVWTCESDMFRFGYAPLTAQDSESIGTCRRIRFNRSGILVNGSNAIGYAEKLKPLLSYASDTEHWYIASDYIYAFVVVSTHVDAINRIGSSKILLPLATPQTADLGYIDLPPLPSGAVCSIPELESIGVSWFVEGCEPLVEHAKNERAYIQSLIAELATA